jgi:hypothetical protein
LQDNKSTWRLPPSWGGHAYLAAFDITGNKAESADIFLFIRAGGWTQYLPAFAY